MHRGVSERDIKSARNTVDIVEVVRRADGATLTEVAQEIDLARSTVHDYLQTLLGMEYLVKEGDEYHVSLKFLDLGHHSKLSRTAWRQVRPALEEIGDETGEHVWFVVEEYGTAVYVDSYSGSRVLSMFNAPGTREHLHCIAAGKAILAHLPTERVDQIVDRHGLPAHTERTITDRDGLHEELEQVRADEVAFCDGEWRDEIRAVASPVVRGDDVIGAVTFGAPRRRLSETDFYEDLPKLVSGAVNRLELSFRKDATQ